MCAIVFGGGVVVFFIIIWCVSSGAPIKTLIRFYSLCRLCNKIFRILIRVENCQQFTPEMYFFGCGVRPPRLQRNIEMMSVIYVSFYDKFTGWYERHTTLFFFCPLDAILIIIILPARWTLNIRSQASQFQFFIFCLLCKRSWIERTAHFVCIFNFKLRSVSVSAELAWHIKQKLHCFADDSLIWRSNCRECHSLAHFLDPTLSEK